MKVVPQYEDYLIYVDGSIYKKSYSYVRKDGMFVRKPIRKLKIHKCKKGYLKCDLYVNGKSVPMKHHRLLAMAYIPNPNNLPQVNHINGIKDDNRVENLEWVDNSQNQIHSNRVLGNRKTVSGRMVIDLETGIYYVSTKDAFRSMNYPYRYEHFCRSVRDSKNKRYTYI